MTTSNIRILDNFPEKFKQLLDEIESQEDDDSYNRDKTFVINGIIFTDYKSYFDDDDANDGRYSGMVFEYDFKQIQLLERIKAILIQDFKKIFQ